MYLLDTNVVSELRKVSAGRGDARVAAWQAACTEPCWLSVVSLMELEIGVLRAERRDAVQGRMLRDWLENVLRPDMAQHLLPVDARVAERAAHLHVPDPRPPNDAFIAATALVHNLVLVTRNTSDFANLGVHQLNPWQAGTVQQAPEHYDPRG